MWEVWEVWEVYQGVWGDGRQVWVWMGGLTGFSPRRLLEAELSAGLRTGIVSPPRRYPSRTPSPPATPPGIRLLRTHSASCVKLKLRCAAAPGT